MEYSVVGIAAAGLIWAVILFCEILTSSILRKGVNLGWRAFFTIGISIWGGWTLLGFLLAWEIPKAYFFVTVGFLLPWCLATFTRYYKSQ